MSDSQSNDKTAEETKPQGERKAPEKKKESQTAKPSKAGKTEGRKDHVDVGDREAFQLMWRKSCDESGSVETCEAMEVPAGCVVKATTKCDGQLSTALVFVPSVKLTEGDNGGKKLVRKQ